MKYVSTLALYLVLYLALCLVLLHCPALANAHTINPTETKTAVLSTNTVAVSLKNENALQPVIRFALIGDAEPKPKAEFPHLAKLVTQLNSLAHHQQLDFVVGVGDIAHKGTEVQYQAATKILATLDLPFYPIMGNEEHESTVARYLKYANQWGNPKNTITQPSFRVAQPTFDLLLVSPDFGRDFNEQGIQWLRHQLAENANKPIFIVSHAAPQMLFEEGGTKGASNPQFTEILKNQRIKAVFSGDLHMDMPRVNHSKQVGHVHFLHIPGIERTKIPDQTQHTAIFRIVNVHSDGLVVVDSYEVGKSSAIAEFAYIFNLND